MSFDLKIVNGDLSIKNGALEIVRDTDKLLQDILKICLTKVGSNPNQPWYGSFLNKSMVGALWDNDVTITSAQSHLQTAIETLKKLQQLQLAEGFQNVTAAEQIAAIMQISINRNKFDPRLYEVMIRVLSKGLTQVTGQFSIRNF